MNRVLVCSGLFVTLVVALWIASDGVYAFMKGPAATEKMAAYVETIPGTDIKFELVPIPGGTFTMGSPADEPKRKEDEGPQHEVTLKPFWMGKTEVTWDEYDLFAFSQDIKKKHCRNPTLPNSLKPRKLLTPSPVPRLLMPIKPSAWDTMASRLSALPGTPPWSTAAGFQPRPERSIVCPLKLNGSMRAGLARRRPIHLATPPA